MLKYVVQRGGETPEVDAEEDKLRLVPGADGEDVPPGACGVLGEAIGDAASLLHAAAQLAKRQDQLLHLLAESIDCREQYSPGSSRRVMDHAGRFAEALGLDEDTRLTIERGALLRDIGKLRIPNSVLLKHSVLTYDEWTLLQSHTAIGAKVVVELGGLWDIEAMVRHHHECFDGMGYPDGLEGEDIPLAARVLKIVDVYCAMTSRRLYRGSVFSHSEASMHLRTESGTHFDPDLVDAFLKEEIGRLPEIDPATDPDPED